MVASRRDRVDADPGEPLDGLGPNPHSAPVGRSPSTSNQVREVGRKTPAGLPKLVASLACSLPQSARRTYGPQRSDAQDLWIGSGMNAEGVPSRMIL